MKERAVDACLRGLLGFYKFGKLLIVEKVIQLCTDPVCKFFGHVLVADQAAGVFVEQFVFQNDREIILIHRILYPVIVVEQLDTSGRHLSFQLPDDTGKISVFECSAGTVGA